MRRVGKKFAAAREQVPEKPLTLEEAVPSSRNSSTPSSTRRWKSPSGSASIRSTPTRWSAAPSCCRTARQTKKVLVIAGGDKQKEAQEAGADTVGGEELVREDPGRLDGFRGVVATPDMMRAVGKLGKVLGPRGLMPNPRPARSRPTSEGVREIKAGKVEFPRRQDRIVHAPVGKVSFPSDRLVENARALVDSIIARSRGAKAST